MQDNNKNGQVVGTSTIATLFGITERRIQQLVKDGILTAEQEKGDLRFRFVVTTQEYIKYLTERAEGKAGKEALNDLEREKLKAEVKLKQEKAGIAELERKELEGQMHRSDDVEAMTTDLIMNVRASYLALPGRLAVDLASITTPLEVRDRINKEIFPIMDELSKYQYDPEMYAQRVRDRQGWTGTLTDETDNE